MNNEQNLQASVATGDQQNPESRETNPELPGEIKKWIWDEATRLHPNMTEDEYHEYTAQVSTDETLFDINSNRLFQRLTFAEGATAMHAPEKLPGEVDIVKEMLLELQAKDKEIERLRGLLKAADRAIAAWQTNTGVAEAMTAWVATLPHDADNQTDKT